MPLAILVLIAIAAAVVIMGIVLNVALFTIALSENTAMIVMAFVMLLT